MKNISYFYFCKELNQKIKDNILKLKNISIIFYERNPHINQEKLKIILVFCKLHKIPLYIYNNYSLAIKIKAHGIFFDSSNKTLIHLFNKKLKFIGVAHCHLDYFNKIKQHCSLIFLSPIFFNKKYSPYKIKGIIKFNLQTNYWKVNKALLGGIIKKKINILNSLNEPKFGGISYFEE